MRDLLTLWCIRLARKWTTWGLTYDDLERAETQQRFWIEQRKKEKE